MAIDLSRVSWVRRLAELGVARAMRLEAGLSLFEVAREIPTSPSSLSRWETGQTKPRAQAAARWAEILESLERRGT